MKAAGLNVVRMGESTWSLWEPEDGQFDYAWMDRIVDAMGKAGIKVILGTPTYSIPAWMAHQHPEILAAHTGIGGRRPNSYGMRQNMDTDSPAYRFYAERLIRHIVAHYKDNPTVIGWQLDNETSSYDAANPDVFIGFQHYLEKKFVTPEALSKAWFLNYWGENLHTWEDLPTRDGARAPATSLSGRAGARCASPTSSTGRRAGARMRGAQPVRHHRLRRHDASRRQRRGHRIVPRHSPPTTSTTARRTTTTAPCSPCRATSPARSSTATSWSPRPTRKPSAGVPHASSRPTTARCARMCTPISSNGANMVEYWHWASIAANQETYWKGVLSHDLEPNRAYAEVSRTAHELEKIGPHLVGLQIHNQVAILWSRDSANAIGFMPFTSDASEPWARWTGNQPATTRWSSRFTTRSTISTSAPTSSFPRPPTSRNTSC